MNYKENQVYVDHNKIPEDEMGWKMYIPKIFYFYKGKEHPLRNTAPTWVIPQIQNKPTGIYQLNGKLPSGISHQIMDILYFSEALNMKSKKYLFENEIQYSKQERKAFLESLRNYSAFKNEIYRSSKLKEVSEQIGSLIESAEAFTLRESDGWFDNVTVSKDLKELKNDYKLFQKTCQEVTQLQQRLESLYENIGTRLGRYYEV